MVWYNLKVGSWSLKTSPLNPIEKEYPYCDTQGNILKKISGKFEKGYFLNEATQEQHQEAFRLINNKPSAKLKKTKEVVNYKEVEVREIEDLLQENLYLVECDSLLNDLLESGKALKFAYTNGNGYKVCIAYVYPSKLYKGYLLMSLGRTRISELIMEIDGLKEQRKKAESITATINGIDRARVEDLIAI